MKITLYYDGDCPFCNKYASILKLKKCFELDIKNSRDDLSWKKCNDNLILDDGVILTYNDKCYQGVEAINMFLQLCKYKGLFFSFQKFIFSNKFLGNIVYSCFKFFRKIALWIRR